MASTAETGQTAPAESTYTDAGRDTELRIIGGDIFAAGSSAIMATRSCGR